MERNKVDVMAFVDPWKETRLMLQSGISKGTAFLLQGANDPNDYF